MPSTPSDAPAPIPAFTPVDILVSVGLSIAIVAVGGGCSFGELKIEAEVWDELVVGFPEESDVDAGVARAMLNPTTAMTPTLEGADTRAILTHESVWQRAKSFVAR
jgi:hypothetical protein